MPSKNDEFNSFAMRGNKIFINYHGTGRLLQPYITKQTFPINIQGQFANSKGILFQSICLLWKYPLYPKQRYETIPEICHLGSTLNKQYHFLNHIIETIQSLCHISIIIRGYVFKNV